jgi:general stress protein CsbA
MTTTSDDRSTDAAGGDELPSGYRVPRQTTAAGRHAFDEVVREFADDLAHELDVQGHRTQRTEPLRTADDVRAARQAYERRVGEELRVDAADRRVLAAILLTLATVGVSVLANFLHSGWQIGLFALFVVAGVVGLVLTWTSRPNRQRRRRA